MFLTLLNPIPRLRPEIAVIIVNFNSWALLSCCLQSLAAQTFQNFSITIIDNASRDNPPDGLLAQLPNAVLIRLAQNIGFAAANNLAVQHHTGESEWVALLNPDAFPEPDWLAQLMRASAAHPDCAVFASRQLNAANSDWLDGDGDSYHMSGKAWRNGYNCPVPASPANNANHHERFDNPTVQPVFSPCGAAALYRRSVFAEAGGFDEEFFCYFEDVDLGFRLQLAGYPCLLVTQAVVHHVGSAATGGQHGDFAVYHGHRNLVWTYVKNMPGSLFWLFLPLHLLLNLVTLLHYRSRLGLIARAKRDALRALPAMLKKRRKIQSHRKVSLTAIWRLVDKRLLPK